ncbi:MAG: hypothetical protein WCY88_08065 [Spongiibacteraceae bacterium]
MSNEASSDAADEIENSVMVNEAWVMTTKQVGDKVAGWLVKHLYEDDVRYLESSERCPVTSFCYPTGVRVKRAKLERVD